jgi:hypothetical protein
MGCSDGVSLPRRVLALSGATGGPEDRKGHVCQSHRRSIRTLNVVDVRADSNPCTGDTGTLTMTYNDIFHGTINKTGSWFAGTVEGTIEFAPDNPAAVTYSGHFAAWFGDENNLRNDVEHSTFNAHLTGTDGTTVGVHDNAQAAMNANGVITVSFDHSTITCS